MDAKLVENMPPAVFEGAEGRTTAATLLPLIARRVRLATGFEEHACFVTLDPHSEASRMPGDVWITTSPASGTFSERMIHGGGVAQATLNWGVLVVIHSTNRLDEVGRSPLWLSGEADQSMELVDRILGALTGYGVVWGLRDPLVPERIDLAEPRQSERTVELTFSCAFDWRCRPLESEL
jgi:hypothetical protein